MNIQINHINEFINYNNQKHKLHIKLLKLNKY